MSEYCKGDLRPFDALNTITLLATACVVELEDTTFSAGGVRG